MSNLKICRICLQTDVNMYNFNQHQLKCNYEEIMSLKITSRDVLPHYFCYECATMLHKFHKFKEKCCKGQKILKGLLEQGPINFKLIKYVRKQNKDLQSPLKLITVNPRVRTYLVKSKEEPKLSKTQEVDIDLDNACVTDYDDNIVEEIPKDDFVPLPELVDVSRKLQDEEKLDTDEGKTDLNIEQKTLVDDDVKIDIEDINLNVNEEQSNIVEEEVSDVKNILEIEKVFTEDEKPISVDDKLFSNNIKYSLDEELQDVKPFVTNIKSTKGSKKKKKKHGTKKNISVKKFEITNKKKTELDSKNWLKFNLSEEEAIEEFKARALQKRFIAAEFKCNDCLKGFSKEEMLNRHIKLRHSESVGPVECRFCHMRFKWKCFLSRHMRQHYTKFKCLRCELVCPLEQTALLHEEYHKGVIRKCKHCGEQFKHLTTYYTHLRTHRSEHVCTLCGASFVSAVGLNLHKKIKHIVQEPGAPQGEQGEEEYCKRCDIKFETRKAFEEHLIHSAMHVDGIEDLEVQVPLGKNPLKGRNSLKRLTRIPTDCYVSDADDIRCVSTTNPSRAKEKWIVQDISDTFQISHMGCGHRRYRLIDDRLPLKCGKHFSTQAACRKHHLAEHPRTSFFAPNERHICEICGISLAPGSVASHLNTHTREKLYSCSTCGKQFNSKGGMTTHQLTHTSEKPVACTLCDKRFRQNQSMKLHYRTFHLKEPYPKRNRKKKSEGVTNIEYPQEESDDNITLDKWT